MKFQISKLVARASAPDACSRVKREADLFRGRCLLCRILRRRPADLLEVPRGGLCLRSVLDDLPSKRDDVRYLVVLEFRHTFLARTGLFDIGRELVHLA